MTSRLIITCIYCGSIISTTDTAHSIYSIISNSILLLRVTDIPWAQVLDEADRLLGTDNQDMLMKIFKRLPQQGVGDQRLQARVYRSLAMLRTAQYSSKTHYNIYIYTCALVVRQRYRRGEGFRCDLLKQRGVLVLEPDVFFSATVSDVQPRKPYAPKKTKKSLVW